MGKDARPGGGPRITISAVAMTIAIVGALVLLAMFPFFAASGRDDSDPVANENLVAELQQDPAWRALEAKILGDDRQYAEGVHRPDAVYPLAKLDDGSFAFVGFGGVETLHAGFASPEDESVHGSTVSRGGYLKMSDPAQIGAPGHDLEIKTRGGDPAQIRFRIIPPAEGDGPATFTLVSLPRA